MNPIDKLIRIFSDFPGIGPKQARRFVYFLIAKPSGYSEDLKREISNLKASVESCTDCKRYFTKGANPSKLCEICADTTRDQTSLMIVGHDIDLNNIEKGHVYLGKYFVLGGLVPILDKNPEQRIRLNELIALTNKMSTNGLKEIILALDANSEGEYTANFLKSSLSPIVEKYAIKISELGRGLSTGTELEYSDPETIKSAFQNRK